MTNDSDRLGVLIAWREELAGQVEQLRRRQVELLDEISNKEAQLRNINQLLEGEGYPIDESRVADGRKEGSLSDRAFAFLKDAFAFLKETDKPWYYRELAERLKEVGVHIPGNDRAANLLAHISRDERFQRVKRGTYGLTEWKTRMLARRRSRTSEERESPEAIDNQE